MLHTFLCYRVNCKFWKCESVIQIFAVLISTRNFARFRHGKLTKFVIITITRGALYETCISQARATFRECPENLMRRTTQATSLLQQRHYDNIGAQRSFETRSVANLFLISTIIQEIYKDSLSRIHEVHLWLIYAHCIL